MQTSQHTSELENLLVQAQQGRDEAYGELIAHATERLLKLTRKMLAGYPHLRRWEGTDDVFQNAAMRLHRSLNDVKPESVRAFFGLAATQIRRTLIDLARHHFGPEGHAARHHTDAAEPNGACAIEQGEALPSKPETLEAWANFHAAIEDLDEPECEVFSLVWYGGLPQKEIAGLLNVSVPTIQRRWYRAQVQLYDALQGQSPEAHDDS
jgi:RNA polymerase sigma-70 factor (ECF subfamily)